jgi:hypothetical protein
MHIFLLLFVASTLFAHIHGAESAVKGTGSTTRQWSCCKNSCSWPVRLLVDKPVLTYDASDNLLANYNRRDCCESGGGSMIARTSVLRLLVKTWRAALQQSILRLLTSLHGVALATRMFP